MWRIRAFDSFGRYYLNRTGLYQVPYRVSFDMADTWKEFESARSVLVSMRSKYTELASQYTLAYRAER